MPESVENYDFGPHDKLFLDANIWLFLYSPQKPGEDFQVKIYSQIMKKILDASSPIYIEDITRLHHQPRHQVP